MAVTILKDNSSLFPSLGGMIFKYEVSQNVFATLLYSLNLWKTVCVYGTKASLVGFLPIEMCVNIGSSHQVTFCSLSSSFVLSCCKW